MIPKYREATKLMLDMKATKPFRILHRLEALAVPVMVVYGRQDPRGRYESAAAVVERIPDVRFETIDKCGHFPFLEHPEIWNKLANDFLSSFARTTMTDD